MNELNDNYYWYDQETDKVIQCNKAQYRKFLDKNNGRKDAIKYDKFNLTADVYIEQFHNCSKEYTVSTVCLPFCQWENFSERLSDRPLIFETIAFIHNIAPFFENKSVLYTNLNYCINEAKSGHDDMILKIIREIKL